MNVLNRIEKFFRRDLWLQDSATLQGLAAFYIKPLRLIVVAISDFRDGVLSIRATSLVSTTLLSLVPFLAVMFSVLKAFGVHQQFEPLLVQGLEPLGEKGSEIAGHIVEFVNNLKVGALGAVGLAGLFYTTYSLIDKIEEALNYIWRCARRATSDQKIYRLLECGPGGTRAGLHGRGHHRLGPKPLARANDITNRTRGDRRALDDGPDAVCADLSRVHVFVQIRSSYAGECRVSPGGWSDGRDLVESRRDVVCVFRCRSDALQCHLFQFCHFDFVPHLALRRLAYCPGRRASGLLSSTSHRVSDAPPVETAHRGLPGTSGPDHAGPRHAPAYGR